MRRGNEVDIMATFLLQGKHDQGQFGRGDLITHPVVADLAVLAENTLECAIGKKDGPGTAPTHQGRFFAKVRPIAADNRPGATPAKTQLTLEPVYPAMVRADNAASQFFVKKGHPPCQLATLRQPEISRLPLPHITSPFRLWPIIHVSFITHQ